MVDYIDTGRESLQSALDRFNDPFGCRDALRRCSCTMDDDLRAFATHGYVKRSQEDADTLLANIGRGNRLTQSSGVYDPFGAKARSDRQLRELREESKKRTEEFMKDFPPPTFEELMRKSPIIIPKEILAEMEFRRNHPYLSTPEYSPTPEEPDK